jgi:copper chaperone CopZ
MASSYTAILHLRDIASPGTDEVLESALRALPGVRDVCIEARELVVTVRFDHRSTGLAEIVRSVEDSGPVVSAVAQRRGAPVAAFA